jgi:hypothetical protein
MDCQFDAKAACNCRNGKSNMSKLWQILECHHFDTLGLEFDAKAACNGRNGKSNMSKLWQILECHHFDTLGLGDQ